MSTQSAIVSDDDFLLFKEAFDDTKIYLQIYDCQELSVRTNHYQGNVEKQVTVGIPVYIWKKIVSEWIDSRCQEATILDLNDSFENLLERNLKKKSTDHSS